MFRWIKLNTNIRKCWPRQSNRAFTESINCGSSSYNNDTCVKLVLQNNINCDITTTLCKAPLIPGSLIFLDRHQHDAAITVNPSADNYPPGTITHRTIMLQELGNISARDPFIPTIMLNCWIFESIFNSKWISNITTSAGGWGWGGVVVLNNYRNGHF